MKIAVHLFARARELAGTPVAWIEVPDQARAGDVRRALALAHPSLAGLLARSALAVNNEFADDSLPLPPNPEVALLPPVSGG